jgi:predicted porin
MNKKLLTVAITAALVAPTAVLADVTVYGKLHMSMDYSDSNTDLAPGAVERKANLGISSNSSRIGFKGDEDLGGGLKAVWQVESTVNTEEGQGSSPNLSAMNTKSGGIATRNTFLGLAGDFGTVLVGKHDTPFKMFGRSLDQFGDTIADSRQLFGDGSGWDLRAPNVLAYITPSFSGFSAVAAYVTGLNESSAGPDNNKLTAFSMNGTYKNGPIYAGLAYEVHNVKNTVAVGDRKNPSALRIGGSYALGAAKIGAMYEVLNDTAIVGEVDRSGWTLFGTYAFGLETVKLAYTYAGEWDTQATGTMNNTDASLLAIGLDHKFSKRTTGYVQYTALTNEDSADYVLGGGGGYGDPVAPGLGKDPSAFSVGLIHNF